MLQRVGRVRLSCHPSSRAYAYKVHDRMDRDTKKHGYWFHRELDLYHCEEGIREWLQKWQHLAYQETLTDYLRVALGHLVLDDIAYWFPHMNEEKLIKSAYRSFIQRGFARARTQSLWLLFLIQ